MENTRMARLAFLRFQVRSLKQQERRLRLLRNKPCGGNWAEAAEELVSVRKQIAQAEDALTHALRASQESPE